MLTRIVKMSFQDERVNKFLAVFDEIKEEVSGQPGCDSVRLVQDIKNAHVFFTISIWDNESDLDRYRDSDFFKKTWTTIKPWFSVKAEAWSTESVWPTL